MKRLPVIQTKIRNCWKYFALHKCLLFKRKTLAWWRYEKDISFLFTVTKDLKATALYCKKITLDHIQKHDTIGKPPLCWGLRQSSTGLNIESIHTIEKPLSQDMKMWKGNCNTTTSFSLKGLEILHQERRGQMKTIVMEHFNGILFHKSGLAYKQHTNHHHHQRNIPCRSRNQTWNLLVSRQQCYPWAKRLNLKIYNINV